MGIAAYAAHAVGLLGGGDIFHVHVHTGLYVVAAVICLLRVIVSSQERRPWALLAVGMAAWAAGFAVWNVHVSGGVTPAFPSAADAGWLVFYATAFPALWLLIRARVDGLPASAWMDGALAALTAAAVVAAFVVVPVAERTGGELETVAASLLYPVLDGVLLIECVVAATLMRTGPSHGFWVAAGAVGMFLVADALFAYTVSACTYDADGLVNIAWPMGTTALAAVRGARATPRPPRRASRRGRTVAEGVEDGPCLRRVAELGCDVAQGFALSRPLPADAVAAFLAARAPAPARPRPARSPAIPLRHAAGPHGHRAHGAG